MSDIEKLNINAWKSELPPLRPRLTPFTRCPVPHYDPSTSALGRRHGSFHVHPNLAKVRSVILHTEGSIVAPGLLSLREPGFRVFTRSQLRTELKQHAKGRGVAAWEGSAGKDDEEHIYALFKTTINPATESQKWDGEALLDLIDNFESDARNKPVANVGRTSAYPRILPLRDVLKARCL